METIAYSFRFMSLVMMIFVSGIYIGSVDFCVCNFQVLPDVRVIIRSSPTHEKVLPCFGSGRWVGVGDLIHLKGGGVDTIWSVPF